MATPYYQPYPSQGLPQGRYNPPARPGVAQAPSMYQPGPAYPGMYRPQYPQPAVPTNMYGIRPGGIPAGIVPPLPQQQQQQQIPGAGMYNPQIIPKAGNPMPNQSSVLTDELRDRMDDPINSYDTNEEREMNDTMSDLYAAMKTLEYLEKSYSNSYLQYYEYSKQCITLIQQITHMVSVIHTTIPQTITMFANMGVKFDRAAVRLREGKPAELPSSAGSFTKMASNITGMMLTLIDYIELDYKSVNELGVKVKELESALVGAAQYLPKDFSFTAVMTKWVKKFNEWGPTYVLPDEELKELKYDLQTGMADFEKAL